MTRAGLRAASCRKASIRSIASNRASTWAPSRGDRSRWSMALWMGTDQYFRSSTGVVCTAPRRIVDRINGTIPNKIFAAALARSCFRLTGFPSLIASTTAANGESLRTVKAPVGSPTSKRGRAC